MDCKRLEVEEVKKSVYAVDEMPNNSYGICYCIRYKPVGATEWILLRGWWNDKGIWTADGIFNDGLV